MHIACRVSALAGECLRRGEGGEEWRGKKDTGYLYKAFMVARVLIPVLTCGGTRAHPQHRATIKALPATPHHPRPYGLTLMGFSLT